MAQHNYLSIADVANKLSVSRSTVRRWVALGRVPCYKPFGRLRFDPVEIENLVRKSKVRKSSKLEIPE